MSQLTDKQREFIAENPYVGTATTLRQDGSPHNTIRLGGCRGWCRDVQHCCRSGERAPPPTGPRAAVTVVHPENSHTSGDLGQAAAPELTTEGCGRPDRSSSQKVPRPGQVSVCAIRRRPGSRSAITPEKVDASGFASSHGATSDRRCGASAAGGRLCDCRDDCTRTGRRSSALSGSTGTVMDFLCNTRP